jgi:predicted O-methyltransferase YrrM
MFLETEVTMNSARDELVSKLWFGSDPFLQFPVKAYAVDHQGWNSHHPYLDRAIEEVRPRTVIEIGVWKGASVITMAESLRRHSLDGVIVAIDTWLGSEEHWDAPEFRADLSYEVGYPKLYHKFVANLFDRNVQDLVVPLPLDSINAFHVIKKLNIRPELIHIDAGHDFRSATSDLEAWWPILPAGGVLIGDDYLSDGSHWPEVKRAFDTYFSSQKDVTFEAEGGKCYVTKTK